MKFEYILPYQYLIDFLYKNGQQVKEIFPINIILSELTWYDLFILIGKNEIFTNDIKNFILNQYYYYLSNNKKCNNKINKTKYIMNYENDLYYKHFVTDKILKDHKFSFNKVENLIQHSLNDITEYENIFLNIYSILDYIKDLDYNINIEIIKKQILLSNELKVKNINNIFISEINNNIEENDFFLYRFNLFISTNQKNFLKKNDLNNNIYNIYLKFNDNEDVKKSFIEQENDFIIREKSKVSMLGIDFKKKINKIFKLQERINIEINLKKILKNEIIKNKQSKKKLTILQISTKLNIQKELVEKYMKFEHKINMIKSKNKKLIEELIYYKIIKNFDSVDNYINSKICKNYIYITENNNKNEKIDNFYKANNYQENNKIDKNNNKIKIKRNKNISINKCNESISLDKRDKNNLKLIENKNEFKISWNSDIQEKLNTSFIFDFIISDNGYTINLNNSNDNENKSENDDFKIYNKPMIIE